MGYYQNLYISTDIEDLIRAIGYAEIREIFEDEIEQECDEAYKKGQDEAANK